MIAPGRPGPPQGPWRREPEPRARLVFDKARAGGGRGGISREKAHGEALPSGSVPTTDELDDVRSIACQIGDGVAVQRIDKSLAGPIEGGL